MKKGKLILVIILLYAINGFSQVKTYNLQYFYNPSASQESYHINYHRSEDKISIIVKTPLPIDSLNKADRLKIFQIMEDDKIPWNEKIQHINPIRPYKTDTLQVKPNKEIVTTVDSFVQNWKRISTHSEKKTDQRIILDGHSITLSLEKKDKDFEKIYVLNPNEKSHPEILELTSKLEDFYKKKI